VLALVVLRCLSGVCESWTVLAMNESWATRVGVVSVVRRWSSRRFPYGYLVTT